MIVARRWRLAVALAVAIGSSARAADKADVVASATKLLEEISANPESGIPPNFLQEAKGILIMPRYLENQLGVGTKKGHGVFLRRNENGEWGSPERAEIVAVSVGAEAGRLVTDTVVIYRTQKAADKFDWDSYTCALSVQVSGWLSPPHAFEGPGPDSKPRKDVLTYTRKHGILVGVAISGARKWGSSQTPAKSKTSSPTPQTPANADSNVAVKVTKLDPSAKPTVDCPGVARLKTVLTALTNPPPPEMAGAGKKDSMVSPTSGPKLSTVTKPKPTGSRSP